MRVTFLFYLPIYLQDRDILSKYNLELAGQQSAAAMPETSVWHFFKNLALLSVSFIFLPFDTGVLLGALIANKLLFRASGNGIPDSRPHERKNTVLVTGVGMTKGLILARLFHRRGHRVIGTDTHRLSSGRVSRAVHKFLLLPDPENADVYVRKLVDIVKKESVDLWVSVSDVNAAVQDAQAKEAIEEQTSAKAVQFGVQEVQTLHDKDAFMDRTLKIGLQIPDTGRIYNKEDILAFLSKRQHLNGIDSGQRYLIKPVGVDDIARSAMPILDLSSPDASIETADSIPFPAQVPSHQAPYIIQELIEGPEFCTHALIVRGRVRAFVACPSSSVLTHYTALSETSPLSRAMLAFTQRQAAAGGAHFNGHMSFDFLARGDGGDGLAVLPIECNPRVHTAVVLFSETPELVDEYTDALWSTASVTHSSGEPLRPRSPRPCYWVGQDLVELVLYPAYLAATRPWRFSRLVQLGASVKEFWWHVFRWWDVTFEVWDPWPWWWMYHVYWPAQFLRYMVHGRWSKINVSTAKAFKAS